MVLSKTEVNDTLYKWVFRDELNNIKKANKEALWNKYTKTLGYQWATFVTNNNWSHTATIRPYRFPLTETRSYDLISRLLEYKKFNKVFYTLEKDTTGFNHCHLLMDTNYDEPSMKHIRWEMNTMLGQKWNSGLVQYVDEIRTKKGITNYVSKHIGTNKIYNLLG